MDVIGCAQIQPVTFSVIHIPNRTQDRVIKVARDRGIAFRNERGEIGSQMQDKDAQITALKSELSVKDDQIRNLQLEVQNLREQTQAIEPQADQRKDRADRENLPTQWPDMLKIAVATVVIRSQIMARAGVKRKASEISDDEDAKEQEVEEQEAEEPDADEATSCSAKPLVAASNTTATDSTLSRSDRFSLVISVEDAKNRNITSDTFPASILAVLRRQVDDWSEFEQDWCKLPRTHKRKCVIRRLRKLACDWGRRGRLWLQSLRLKAKSLLVILCDFTAEALEWQLFGLELSTLLILLSVAESNSSWPIAVREFSLRLLAFDQVAKSSLCGQDTKIDAF